MATLSKTATPELYIETVQINSNFAEGWVGSWDSSGNPVPERGAYIYFYLNGFLVNPPELNTDGSYKTTGLTVLTDKNGFWKTASIYFGKFGLLQSGQVLTLRARTPFKSVSDFSVPYVIGGTPVPFDIGVIDSFGDLRPPNNGEISIVGRMTNWIAHKTIRTVDNHGNVLSEITAGQPNFDFNNRIFVYIDGERKGELLKNHIYGKDAVFPTFADLGGKFLDLMVDNQLISIPLDDFSQRDRIEVYPIPDGIITTFHADLLTSEVGTQLFRNGQRQTNIDQVTTIDSDTKIATFEFNVPPEPNDRLSLILQLIPAHIQLEEVPVGSINGVNTLFTLNANPLISSVRVYKNGLELNTSEYFLHGGNKLTFNFPPITTDTVVVDYQLIITGMAQFLWTVIPSVTSYINSIKINDIEQVYDFTLPSGVSSISVYKNGLLLTEDIDYTMLSSTRIKFGFVGDTPVEEYAVKDGDYLLVNVNLQQLSLQTLIENLSKNETAKNLGVEFATLTSPRSNSTIVSYSVLSNQNQTITFDFSQSLSYIKIYKNGLRQIESIDYTFDPIANTATFILPLYTTDQLVAVYDYNTSKMYYNQILSSISTKSIADYTGYAISTQVARPDNIQLYVDRKRVFNFQSYTNIIFIPDSELTFDIDNNITSIVMVDYQSAASASQRINYISIPTPSPNDIITEFTFNPQTPQQWSLGVFLNGLRQTEATQFTFSNSNAVYKINFTTPPPSGSELRVELTVPSVSTGGEIEQLDISCLYRLDLADLTLDRQIVYDLLLGKNRFLSPGKGEDGDFKFFFNRRDGTWKYTNFDKTGVEDPFIKGQHIQVVALNMTPISILAPSSNNNSTGIVVDPSVTPEGDPNPGPGLPPVA